MSKFQNPILRLLKGLSHYAGDYFALWVLLGAVAGLLRPPTFQMVTPHIPLMLGFIMFGMGMTLKVDDFDEVFKRPKEVGAGVLAQYTIMPLLAFGIAELFRLPSDMAIGVVLLGACPGGTASNVITYLARGDVALSVAMTSVSTLLAPLMTPLITLWLAGSWAPVPVEGLFISVVKIVLIPVLLGLAAHRYFAQVVERYIPLLPLISVITIVAVVGAIIGANAEHIITVAATMFLVVILHNLLGLALGYGLGSSLKMKESHKRAIAVEVGMQNSGLSVALAMTHFNPIAAIPGALFSVWHNISGAILATWWNRKS